MSLLNLWFSRPICEGPERDLEKSGRAHATPDRRALIVELDGAFVKLIQKFSHLIRKHDGDKAEMRPVFFLDVVGILQMFKASRADIDRIRCPMTL